jgi:hypothetical protein
MTQVMKKLQQTHQIETKWKINKKKLSKQQQKDLLYH